MPDVKFTRNPGFARELKAEPEFQAFMVATTVAVADAITQAAPRKTGYYRRHVRAAGASVRIGDPFWHLVESGSKNNPAYAPIRRGVRAAGLRYHDARGGDTEPIV